MWFLLALSAALAGTPDRSFTWQLTANGNPIGQRTTTVKVVDNGARRVIDSTTDVAATIGPASARYRQRMTAHATGDPASFHAISDQNGNLGEVQARWTPGGWYVTVNAEGRERTYDLPVGRIQLSTVDLLDPDSRYSLDRFESVRLLSAETGDVLEGKVSVVGPASLALGGKKVETTHLKVNTQQGTLQFWYTADGVLAKYAVPMLGLSIEGTLTQAPPGGADDFAVGLGGGKIEVLDL